jgi:hypothetical protein
MQCLQRASPTSAPQRRAAALPSLGRTCSTPVHHVRRATRATAAAAAVITAEPAAATSLDPILEAHPGLRGVQFFGPELTDTPGKLMAKGVPFLTRQAGVLPVQPRSLDHALDLYGG